MFDPPRLALYFGSLATVILFLCIVVLISANSGSRNLSLAVGTLSGAFIFLAIQLYYELQATVAKSAFGTEFSIDYERHIIAQFRYPRDQLGRATIQSEANKLLNSSYFDGDGEKLWRDMSLWSLVAYLWSTQHDWQISRTTIATSLSINSSYAFLSDRNDKSQCSRVDWGTIQEALKRSGNLLSDIKPFGLYDFMCLPPGSTIEITTSSVQIATPFCTIRFDVDPRWMSVWNALPDREVILMTDKRPRYQTRQGVIRSTIQSSRLRAQNNDMPKYKAWANDVVERAQQWFGPPKLGEIYIKSELE